MTESLTASGREVLDVEARRHQRRAKWFFWMVLVMASSASIAGNAAHSLVATDLAVPARLAVGVAVAPPIILMLSIEGLSMLVRSGRRSKVTFRLALSSTGLLAVFAFVLSFEALRNLAVRSGIPEMLAWMWPVIVDVSIAQATLALLALWRPAEVANDGAYEDLDDMDGEFDDDEVGEPDVDAVVGDDHAQRALVVLRTRKIRQSPETVQRVLALDAVGVKVNEIATRLDVHHSTVRRILGAARAARGTHIPESRQTAALRA
jgi:DNA-directed RNA polymerase specialized sigma24 family protein